MSSICISRRMGSDDKNRGVLSLVIEEYLYQHKKSRNRRILPLAIGEFPVRQYRLCTLTSSIAMKNPVQLLNTKV